MVSHDPARPVPRPLLVPCALATPCPSRGLRFQQERIHWVMKPFSKITPRMAPFSPCCSSGNRHGFHTHKAPCPRCCGPLVGGCLGNSVSFTRAAWVSRPRCGPLGLMRLGVRLKTGAQGGVVGVVFEWDAWSFSSNATKGLLRRFGQHVESISNVSRTTQFGATQPLVMRLGHVPRRGVWMGTRDVPIRAPFQQSNLRTLISTNNGDSERPR